MCLGQIFAPANFYVVNTVKFCQPNYILKGANEMLTNIVLRSNSTSLFFGQNQGGIFILIPAPPQIN